LFTLRYIIIVVSLLFTAPQEARAQAVWGNQLYGHTLCQNPTCDMCWGPNGIAAQLRAQQSVSVVPSQATVEYETVQVPVVTQVKRCNGVTCWYESVTTYRTERRPVRNTVKAAAKVVRDVADVATPRIDMLRVTDLVPTPQDAVVEMLALAELKPTDVLYDLGCGDGRVLVAASSGYGCRSVGVELNADSFRQAASRIEKAGLSGKIRIYQGDVLSYSYPEADVVTMYLYPELMAKVLKQLRRGTRVVSYLHPIPGGVKHVVNNHTFYTWVVR